MHVTGRSRKRRKLKAEINVVPYIDVMLVLLIIFMVTAPMLNLGVDIQLPQSAAKSVTAESEPILISVDKDGSYFLTLAGAPREQIGGDDLARKVAAYMRQNPQTSVRIGGDQRADYGKIYQVMVLLQAAGVPKVGLMSQPVQPEPRR